MSAGPALSVVVPAFNERESLAPLHGEMAEAAAKNGLDFEMVVVDDGSTDGTWEVIRQLAAADARVRGIRLRRNCGKASALMAGFRAARGRRVVTMDADLQDDPAMVPMLLAVLDQGYHVVSGWKQVRHDPWHKVFPSHVFNGMVSRLTGVRLHDHNCGLKAFTRDAVDALRLYGERHRFVPVLLAAHGFRVTERPVNHRARKFGHSKYGASRFVKGFLDLLSVAFVTRFGGRPNHLLGGLGLLCFLTAGLVLVGTVAAEAVAVVAFGMKPDVLFEIAAVCVAAVFTIFGVNLLGLGLVAELLVSRHEVAHDSDDVAERAGPA